MFEAHHNQAGLIKKIVESVKDLVQDVNIECSTSGMQLQAMDSSHVALVALLLRSDGFKTFRCDKTLSLGLNFASLSKILKCASNDDSITMRTEENSLCFEFAGSNKKSVFDLKLIDIEGDALGIPDTDYTAVIKMSAAEFQRICKDLTILGETVTISATKEGVKFSTVGDLGKGEISVHPSKNADEEEENVVVDLQEPVSLTFALRYLNFFTKATSLSKQVILSMRPEVPLVVEYTINDLGYIRYYLAPKIEDE